jgi:hypothetical protein
MLPVLRGGGTGEGAGLDALLSLGAEAEEGAGEGSELHRLVLGEVAELDLLDHVVGPTVDEEQIDEAHDVVRAQPLQLLQDPAFELSLVELDDEDLHRSEFHLVLLPGLTAYMPWSSFWRSASNCSWVSTPSSSSDLSLVSASTRSASEVTGAAGCWAAAACAGAAATAGWS